MTEKQKKEKLKKGLEKLEIKLDEDKINKILIYINKLKEVNKKTNLTAITDDEEIIEKHFIDSLSLLSDIPSDAKKIIDIGTGPGFPGLVLALSRPDLDFTLLDSVGKKIDFVKSIAKELNLTNVKIFKRRAEDFIKQEKVRESFDVGVCRAVSQLNVILEYILPYLKDGGVFLAQKISYKQEVKEAQNCLNILNSKIINTKDFKLPFSGDDRAILVIKKEGKIKGKYPRRTGIPKKRPL
ncbi:MAG: 16S rRNA (guanine(527)-N(7))-methyltransferase RsmG [Fusobacteriota bacterium]